ncbi:hypothetical protein [uncultured Eubacterium sp.]|uniref:hypothetical protein n=1 Tax=uncultured Eubacterium sp. TaxID=165185 RepID=UPI0032667543
MKYRVEASAYVEVFRTRNMTIYANSEEEVIKKAIEKFDEEQYRSPKVSCVNTVEINNIIECD